MVACRWVSPVGLLKDLLWNPLLDCWFSPGIDEWTSVLVTEDALYRRVVFGVLLVGMIGECALGPVLCELEPHVPSRFAGNVRSWLLGSSRCCACCLPFLGTAHLPFPCYLATSASLPATGGF